jgi:Dolichyl-phosphate-mannose-protein mannosyltransferase
MKRSLSLLAWTGILLLAAVVRVSPVEAGRPYINYIDEGNFLHPVAKLLREGGWDPRWYMYPQFPVTAVITTTRLYAPVYQADHGRPLRWDLSIGRQIYDILEPYELIAIGRLLSFLVGLGIVILTGLFARRLAGLAAGLFAAFLAALTPALAIRGAIATVDPYAAFFALASLYFTDRARTSARPGLDSLAAGAMAGCAFASKYPSMLVLTAFALTMLLERIGWKERFRRGLLAGAGLVLGLALAMPAVFLHPIDVKNAIYTQAVIYAHLTSDVLWRQAILRAEWDLPYEHPELGIVYLLLMTAGLILALRDRRLAPTVCGWLLFAAICVVLYARQPFQPFRNLLPLVPPSCLAVAILFAKVRERLRRPVWADLGAAVLIALLFGVPLAGYARQRFLLVDSRKQAVDWLAANAPRGESALFVRELAFVQSELARSGVAPELKFWQGALPKVRTRQHRFLVAGVLERQGRPPVDVAALQIVRRGYRLRARFGENITSANNQWWHGNRQTVYVLERKERIRRPQPPAALPGAQRPPEPAERRGAGRRSSAP